MRRAWCYHAMGDVPNNIALCQGWDMCDDQRMLEFRGRITGGVGLYSEMVIPGRQELSRAPSDWPVKICPGSLNVVIDAYPDGFTEPVGGSRGVYQLDDGRFRPEFVVPGPLIVNNKLMHNGEAASAQVWRARLLLTNGATKVECWAVRRFGSNVGKGQRGNVLELVSEHHLRTKYNLNKDDEPVVVTLIEGGS